MLGTGKLAPVGQGTRPHFPDSPGGTRWIVPPGLFKRSSGGVCDRVPMAVIAAAAASTAHHAHHGTSIGSTISQLLDSVGKFFSQLANLSWFSLLIGLVCYGIYLLLRSRALFNAIRAAYPGEKVRWRDVWAPTWSAMRSTTSSRSEAGISPSCS